MSLGPLSLLPSPVVRSPHRGSLILFFTSRQKTLAGRPTTGVLPRRLPRGGCAPPPPLVFVFRVRVVVALLMVPLSEKRLFLLRKDPPQSHVDFTEIVCEEFRRLVLAGERCEGPTKLSYCIGLVTWGPLFFPSYGSKDVLSSVPPLTHFTSTYRPPPSEGTRASESKWGRRSRLLDSLH